MDRIRLNKMVLVLGVMAFWAQGDNYAATPLLMEMAKDLGIPISRAMLSVTAYMLPFGLFTLIFGPLADKYGKARTINMAAFVTAIFSGLGAVAYNMTSLSLIRGVSGAFAAVIIPVSLALIGESSVDDPKAAQGALAKFMGMVFLGGAVAPAIGGMLSFLGSWRFVYFVYGGAELIMAIWMIFVLEKDAPKSIRLRFTTTYKEAICTEHLVKVVGIVFIMGFSVFGSFAFAGKYIESATGYNILIVGLFLSVFGVSTIVGGRKIVAIGQLLGNKILVVAGVIGLVFWIPFGLTKAPLFITMSLAGLGLAFIMIQPTLVATAQSLRPSQRGTVMSLVSFNLFVGGGLGVYFNGLILERWGYAAIFLSAGTLLCIAGIFGTRVLNGMHKKCKIESLDV